MSTQLREGMPSLPVRMRKLAVDERGYPVPWFVAWPDGKPDFRIADGEKARRAMRFGLCWVCGEAVGKHKTFVIGPMCAVNRTTAEPPCHFDCAEFSATACPFLTLPKAKRNERNIPDCAIDPAGEMIPRNPGVTLLWTTLTYSLMQVENGYLYRLGEPESVCWYAQKRPATRAEVLGSIESGLPILREMAEKEGPQAVASLTQKYEETLVLLPAA